MINLISSILLLFCKQTKIHQPLKGDFMGQGSQTQKHLRAVDHYILNSKFGDCLDQGSQTQFHTRATLKGKMSPRAAI